jgi:hypothetical protein
MVLSSVHVSAWLELAVIVLQFAGVAALLLHRLAPSSRWAERGRNGFVVALVGLGVSGALCGRQGSEFGLFAGGTMTLLLIGMTIGSAHAHTTDPRGPLSGVEPKLAG